MQEWIQNSPQCVGLFKLRKYRVRCEGNDDQRASPSMCKIHRPALVEVLLAGLIAAYPIGAAPSSITAPSCALPVLPTASSTGALPIVAAWMATANPSGWVLPSCIAWSEQRFTSFAAVGGPMQGVGLDEILGRIGGISGYKGMRYWSVTDGRLEALITDAFAVENPAFKIARPDYTPFEMQAGHEIYFMEQDNRLSEPVLYRMRIVERSNDQVVIDISNVSRVRKFLLTLFEPGQLRTALFISGTPRGNWTCYALSGFHPTALTGLLDTQKSRLNRLLALFGHLAPWNDTELPWAK